MPNPLIIAPSKTPLQIGILAVKAAPGLASGVRPCSFCFEETVVDEGSWMEALGKGGGLLLPLIICHRCAWRDIRNERRLPLPDTQHREVRDAMYQLYRQRDEGAKYAFRMRPWR